MYGRIDLTKIHEHIDIEIFNIKPSLDDAKRVYEIYCKYKKFKSVIPLYHGDIDLYEWFCYFQNHKLVAWQQTMLYPNDKVAFNEQFAWDYVDPSKKLGWRFNHHVSSWLKNKDYKYLYMGHHEPYKSKLQGYEIVKTIKYEGKNE